jgi:hypothetical protein
MIQEVDVFFNEFDFAEPFEVTFSNGSKKSVMGIWNSENTPTEINGVTVINNNPSVEFPYSIVSSLTQNCTVKRKYSNEIFYVLEPPQNVEGFATVNLSRVSANE